MTLEQIKSIPLHQTRGVYWDSKDDLQTKAYLMECVHRLWGGDFGTVPEEDTQSNLEELEAGEGRIVARYNKACKLEDDIYIICYFSATMDGLDYNNTTIMYVNEY